MSPNIAAPVPAEFAQTAVAGNIAEASAKVIVAKAVTAAAAINAAAGKCAGGKPGTSESNENRKNNRGTAQHW